MPNYRRYLVPGATYFFTLKTERNAPLFSEDTAVRILGDVLREMRTRWPVETVAFVLLPDHLHAIWSLPPGDAAYPARWGWVKKTFSQRHLGSGGAEQERSDSRVRNRRRGVWQRRFWEHMIRDEDEFEAYFDYVHWNPVKHGWVRNTADWPHSTFHRWVKAGVYPPDWGRGENPPGAAGRVTEAGE